MFSESVLPDFNMYLNPSVRSFAYALWAKAQAWRLYRPLPCERPCCGILAAWDLEQLPSSSVSCFCTLQNESEIGGAGRKGLDWSWYVWHSFLFLEFEYFVFGINFSH